MDGHIQKEVGLCVLKDGVVMLGQNQVKGVTFEMGREGN